MIDGFYLGERVTVERLLGGGWCVALTAKGKPWKHWADQIKKEPWGDVPASEGEGTPGA
jgi:hypothetical protein